MSDTWYAYECHATGCPTRPGTGAVLDLRLPWDRAEAPAVLCPACGERMGHRARWPADEAGYGSRGGDGMPVRFVWWMGQNSPSVTVKDAAALPFAAFALDRFARHHEMDEEHALLVVVPDGFDRSAVPADEWVYVVGDLVIDVVSESDVRRRPAKEG